MRLRSIFSRDFERVDLLLAFTEKELRLPGHRFEQQYIDLFYLAVMALWTKSVKTSKAIVLLCDAGLGTDANALVRTLVETAISCRYLCQKDQNERALWYASYPIIDQKRIERALRRTGTRLSSKDREQLSRLQQLYEAAVRRRTRSLSWWKRFRKEISLIFSRWGIMPPYWPTPQTWSGKHIGKMAKEVELPSFYDFPYQLLSPIVHATDPTNHIELLDPNKADPTKGVRFLIDPDDRHIENALVTTALALDETLRAVYEALQLPRWDELEKLCAANRSDIRTVA